MPTVVTGRAVAKELVDVVVAKELVFIVIPGSSS
jgi:hypothetical protein